MQVRLESVMVGESYLLEKAGSKRHANYTLECSFSGTLWQLEERTRTPVYSIITSINLKALALPVEGRNAAI